MEFPLWTSAVVRNSLNVIKFKHPSSSNTTSSDDNRRQTVASFDLDGTIIKTKSGETFSRDHKDWEFLYNIIPRVFKQLHEDKCNIVIFTNQKGISRNSYILNSFKKKLYDICVKLDVPLTVYVALMDDEYRKPSTGMWDYFSKDIENIDMSNSFFVGDAAGRPATPIKKRDHSDSDKKFANAVGITFYTPERYFLKKTDNHNFKDMTHYFTRSQTKTDTPQAPKTPKNQLADKNNVKNE